MPKAKEPRFIADRIRVSPMKLRVSDAYIFIEVREARKAPITSLALSVEAVPALIEALSAAALRSSRKARKGGE